MKSKKGYTIIWFSAAVLSAWLYFHWHITKDFVGIVESRSHLVGSQDAGIMKCLLVTVEDSVEKGQIVATLDNTDLKKQLNQLQNELSEAEELKESHRKRFLLEYQQILLELENEASDVTDRLSRLEARLTELNLLEAEISRLEKAEAAGLGRDRDLSDLILRRDALQSYMKSQTDSVRNLHEGTSSRSQETLASVTNDEVLNSLLADSNTHISELKRMITQLESEISQRTVVSPCDGLVVNVFAYPGDTVQAFSPILKVEETRSNIVNMYLPETADFNVEKGMRAKVFFRAFHVVQHHRFSLVYPSGIQPGTTATGDSRSGILGKNNPD